MYSIYLIHLDYPTVYTGAIYVGITANIEQRKRQHFSLSSRILRPQEIEAITLGLATVEMIVIDKTPNRDTAMQLEQVYIHLINRALSSKRRNWILRNFNVNGNEHYPLNENSIWQYASNVLSQFSLNWIRACLIANALIL